MKRFKFGNQKLYVIPGTSHRFRTEHDARFYCDEHGIDFADVEKYDSTKEYNRWLELRLAEKAGMVSGLRRQVEYELLPAQYERQYVKDKTVKEYLIPANADNEWIFTSKKAAMEECRSRGIPYKEIVCEERQEAVYKEVCLEKSAVYTADFVYTDEHGKEIVEDVKSDITRKEADYVLRRKMMLYFHHIKIKET